MLNLAQKDSRESAMTEKNSPEMWQLKINDEVKKERERKKSWVLLLVGENIHPFEHIF